MLVGVLQSVAGVPFILCPHGSFAVMKVRSNFLLLKPLGKGRPGLYFPGTFVLYLHTQLKSQMRVEVGHHSELVVTQLGAAETEHMSGMERCDTFDCVFRNVI